MNSSLEQLQASDEINLFELFFQPLEKQDNHIISIFSVRILGIWIPPSDTRKYSGEFVLREPTGRQIAGIRAFE